MLVSDFDYELPEDLIAQEPLADRGASRMLLLDRASGELSDRHFSELPGILRSGDLLVLNNTRVIRARLFGHRSGTRAQPISPRNPAAREFLQGKVEVLLTKQVDDAAWEALVHPGRKIGVGERIHFADDFEAEVVGRGTFGERTLKFHWSGDFWERLDRLGHVPLPPYIARDDRPADAARYQTVYARHAGSAAAPTAGLHFTADTLARIREQGIETAELTLHVGLGTFQPVHAEEVERHRMHSERYTITPETADAVNRSINEKRRVIAVGTTSVRTLEHAGRPVTAGSGETAMFIYPGYQFQVITGLLTNFHLPRSTLLMLVCAFAGRDHVLRAYNHAVQERYRFFSYGDCMLVL